MRLPFLGSFISSVYLAQFTQAVALLTTSKVPMLNSIQLVRKMIGFYPLNEALARVEKHILAGHSMHRSMANNKMFDNKMVSLVKVAEETNQTEYIFERLNQQYAIEVQQKSKMLSTLIEPLIIVVVGIFVWGNPGFHVFANVQVEQCSRINAIGQVNFILKLKIIWGLFKATVKVE